MLLDTGRPTEAMPLIRQFLDNTNLPAQVRAMHRLWAIAAIRLKNDIAPAAAALEADLTDANLGGDRAVTVMELADLYRAGGQSQQELQLLKVEIQNPHTQLDQLRAPVLAERYRSLLLVQKGSGDFSAAVSDWMKRNRPDWYEFAHPLQLAEIPITELEAAVDRPPATRLPGESAKLGLLVAQSPTLSAPLRESAFAMAIDQLAGLCHRHDEQHKILFTVLHDPRFPEWMRRHCLYNLLADTQDNRLAQLLLEANPLAAAFSPEQRRRSIRSIACMRSITTTRQPCSAT